MARRKRKGTPKNREAQTWSPPEPRLTLRDETGTHCQYGTHRTAAMEDRRQARVAKHYGTPEPTEAERPCARGTVGCSVRHVSGYERCETW